MDEEFNFKDAEAAILKKLSEEIGSLKGQRISAQLTKLRGMYSDSQGA